MIIRGSNLDGNTFGSNEALEVEDGDSTVGVGGGGGGSGNELLRSKRAKSLTAKCKRGWLVHMLIPESMCKLMNLHAAFNSHGWHLMPN